jgi:hypothetical protein
VATADAIIRRRQQSFILRSVPLCMAPNGQIHLLDIAIKENQILTGNMHYVFYFSDNCKIRRCESTFLRRQ